jgi:hypothetical protein
LFAHPAGLLEPNLRLGEGKVEHWVYEMASDSGNLVRIYSGCSVSRRLVRHQAKENARTRSNSEFTQASEALDEKSYAYSFADYLCQAKESFAHSIANGYAEEQLETKKGKPDADTGTKGNA